MSLVLLLTMCCDTVQISVIGIERRRQERQGGQKLKVELQRQDLPLLLRSVFTCGDG